MTTYGIALNGSWEVFGLCHKKLQELGERSIGGISVPEGSLIISFEGKKVKDCQLTHWRKADYEAFDIEADADLLHTPEWYTRSIAYDLKTFGPITWLDVATFLNWNTLLDEESALRAFAKMYQSGNPDEFLQLLSDDFRYVSQWVLDEMNSKNRYARYIREKLQAIRNSGGTIESKLGYWQDRPALVMSQEQNGEKNSVTVLATVAGGFISGIAMCKVPTLHEVEFRDTSVSTGAVNEKKPKKSLIGPPAGPDHPVYKSGYVMLRPVSGIRPEPSSTPTQKSIPPDETVRKRDDLTEHFRKGFREQYYNGAPSSLISLRSPDSPEQTQPRSEPELTSQPTADTNQKAPTLVSHRLMKTGIGARHSSKLSRNT